MKKSTLETRASVLLAILVLASATAGSAAPLVELRWSARFLPETVQVTVLDALFAAESSDSPGMAWLVVGSSESREGGAEQTLHLWGVGGDGTRTVSTPIAAAGESVAGRYLGLARLEDGEVAVAYALGDVVNVRAFGRSAWTAPRQYRLPASVSSIDRAVIHPDGQVTIQVVEGATRSLVHFADAEEPVWHLRLAVAEKVVVSVMGMRLRGREVVMTGVVADPADPTQTAVWVGVASESGALRASKVIEAGPRVIPFLIASGSDEIAVQLGAAARRQPVRIARLSRNLELLGEVLLPAQETENRPFAVVQRCSSDFVYGTRQKIPDQGNRIHLTEVRDSKALHSFDLETTDRVDLKSVSEIVLYAESEMLLAAATIVKMDEQRQFNSGIDLGLYRLPDVCQTSEQVGQVKAMTR